MYWVVKYFFVGKDLLWLFLDAEEESWGVIKEIGREICSLVELETEENSIRCFCFREI